MGEQPARASINDVVIKIGTVNGSGSASANGLLLKALFRMGIPVCGKNYFPSNIQGLPTRCGAVAVTRYPDLIPG
ncbi:MAG: hypothetical protein AAGJ36_02530, partial [Pseudomonadota bacterium]